MSAEYRIKTANGKLIVVEAAGYLPFRDFKAIINSREGTIIT